MHLCTRGSYGFLLARAIKAMRITRLSITSARNPTPTYSGGGLPWGPCLPSIVQTPVPLTQDGTPTIPHRRHVTPYSTPVWASPPGEKKPPHPSFAYPNLALMGDSSAHSWLHQSFRRPIYVSVITQPSAEHLIDPTKGSLDHSTTQGRRHALQHPQHITIPPSHLRFA